MKNRQEEKDLHKKIETLKEAVKIYQFGLEKDCKDCGSNGVNFDVDLIEWVCMECD